VVCGQPPASLVRDRAKEDPDEHQNDSAELLGKEQEEMVDYSALATTPVTTAELRRGKLATEGTMRAYRGSAATANMTMVKRGSWRSTGRSRLAATRRRRRARERESHERNGTVHATGAVVATCRTRWELTSGTNGDVRIPRVQTRGVTGELLPTDAASIQLQSRLKLDFGLH